MQGILPFLLLSGRRAGGMFGSGMIRKVLMYSLMGPIGMLLGGRFNVMDFFLIPQIAPMFSSIFGSIGGMFGGGAAAPAGSVA